MHKSGFVNIIGNPNVGKSTLMNALVGERMSIITRKPQTTRHRIIGILGGEDFQVVFSDTPGWISRPAYQLHEAMNQSIQIAYEDADLVLLMTAMDEDADLVLPLVKEIEKRKLQAILLINKIDLSDPAAVQQRIQVFSASAVFTDILPISAKEQAGTEGLLKIILDKLPEGPPYYPKDQLTDRPERFFVSEIIREKILILYEEEIPYSCEVVVETFKTETGRKGPFIRIEANIFVNRKSQKGILIGKGGEAIKRLGIEARKDIEIFLESKVHLVLYVKVRPKWRDQDYTLKQFGYKH